MQGALLKGENFAAKLIVLRAAVKATYFTADAHSNVLQAVTSD